LEDGPPKFPRGSTCPAVLRTAAQEASPLSPTGLSPSLACRSRAVRLAMRFVNFPTEPPLDPAAAYDPACATPEGYHTQTV
jgi:hypothetical protein